MQQIKNLQDGMPYGQMNVLNFGYYYIFNIVKQLYQGKTYIPNIDDLLKKMGCHTPYEKNLDTLFEMLLTYGNIKNAVKWAKMLNENSTHSKVKSKSFHRYT